MNISLKRTLLAILVAVFLASVLLVCGQAFFLANNVANADGESNIEFSVDGVDAGEDVELSPGKTFTLTAKFDTVRTDAFYYAFAFDIGAIDDSGVKIDAITKHIKFSPATGSTDVKTAIDSGMFVSQYQNLAQDRTSTRGLGLYVTSGLKTGYDRNQVVECDDNPVLKIKITISKDILDDDAVVDLWTGDVGSRQLEFKFGIIYQTGSVSYRPDGSTSVLTDRDSTSGARAGVLTYNTLNFVLNEKSSDVSITGIHVGYDKTDMKDRTTDIIDEDDNLIYYGADEELTTADAEDAMFIVIIPKDVNPFDDDGAPLPLLIKPDCDESATYSVTDQGPTGVFSGPDADGNLSIGISDEDEDGNVELVYIKIVAETGAEKVYTIQFKLAYVRLIGLTVKADAKSIQGNSEALLKNRVKEDLTNDNFSYTVEVPIDTESVILNAIVSELGGESSDIVVTSVKCSIEGDYFTPSDDADPIDPKEGQFNTKTDIKLTALEVDGVTSFKDEVVELIVTAQTGDTVTYILTFDTVNTDVDIKEFTVTGTTEHGDDNARTTYHNNTKRAEKAEVDYFFEMKDEDDTQTIKGIFNITLPDLSDATVIIKTPGGDEINYFDDGNGGDNTLEEYELGDYIIVVTAGAGNSKEYTVTLSGLLSINLAFDSEYRFEFEFAEEEGPFIWRTRRTYDENNDRLVLGDPNVTEYYEHGAIDLDWEMVVLGEILPRTLMSTFIDNIDSKIHNRIRLYYPEEDVYVYNCGAWDEDWEDIAFDERENIFVGTGWYLEMLDTANGSTVVDTIYLSILGDISGNGYYDGDDTGMLGDLIMTADFGEVDLLTRLTALILNPRALGVSGDDYALAGDFIMGDQSPENFFYKPDELEPDWDEE